jgi:hypothetical protein
MMLSGKGNGPIAAPKLAGFYQGRALDIRNAMDQAVAAVVQEAARAGWRPREVYDALSEVTIEQRMRYEENPDPSDDTQILGG